MFRKARLLACRIGIVTFLRGRLGNGTSTFRPGFSLAKKRRLWLGRTGSGAKAYMPVVMDNLLAKGEMPKTVGIFIAPGVFADKKSNRSFEYDTLSDQYVRFLMEEIFPEVEKTVKLSHDREKRAIFGISSGGICAFTAAWERPDQFSKVMSWVGSFTNIAHGASGHDGGHNYPALIRVTDKKPIRVFLQDGANDLDNEWGNWPLANQSMAKSLAFKGYDYKFEFGHGMHSDKHGRSILPDSLRWLWRPARARFQGLGPTRSEVRGAMVVHFASPMKEPVQCCEVSLLGGLHPIGLKACI